MTWRSGTTKVATIKSTGVATAVAAGSSTIQATSNSISGSTVLTVVASQSQAITANGTPTTQAPRNAGDPSQGGGSGRPSTLRDVYCFQKSAQPGDRVSCELRVTANTSPRRLRLATNSEAVRIPAVIQARPGQSKVRFEVRIDSTAPRQTAVETAIDGDTEVQDAISVTPAAKPVLQTPGPQAVTAGQTLSFSVTAVEPDGLPTQVSAAGLPEGSSYDGSTGQFNWSPSASQAGSYEVTFRAVNSAGASSSSDVRIAVGSGSPVLKEGQTLTCSPNAVASLSGTWLGASSSADSEPSGSAGEPGGAKVRVNGQYVPVLRSSTWDVEFVCPDLPAGTALSAAVENTLGSSTAVAGTVREATPRILTVGENEGAQGLISFQDGGSLAMPRNADVGGRPALPGQTVLIWATGLGEDAKSRMTDFSVMMGGVDLPVEGIDPAAGRAGLYTVQVRVPLVSGDAVPVQLRAVTPTVKVVSSSTVSAAVEAGN